MFRKLIFILAILPSLTYADMYSFCNEFVKMAYNIRHDYLQGVSPNQLLNYYSRGSGANSLQFYAAQNLINSTLQVPKTTTPTSFAQSANQSCPRVWSIYKTM